jgi:hypothetical protein
MASKTNDQTMDRTLRQVLGEGNAEQNQHYPPNVFDTHYNLVTSFILTEGVKVFGESQYIRDLLRPFFKIVLLPVIDGKAELPDDYRHYTGVSIFVTPDFSSCVKIEGLAEGEVPTDEQLKTHRDKNKVKSWDLDLKEVDEYNYLSHHPYKEPDLEYAIGTIKEANYIMVNPFDIPFLELHYLKQPKVYKYGYADNLDDTYSYNPSMKGAVETEWRTNADELLFKGVNTLYSIYVRDGELRDGMSILKKEGLF